MDELAPGLHARINTETEIEENVRTILSTAYTKRRAQVEGIIASL